MDAANFRSGKISSSTILSLIAILIAIIVCIGWVAHIPILSSFYKNAPSMKFNAAVSFILLGVGIILFDTKSDSAFQNLLIRVLPSVVLLFVLAILVEIIFEINLGIDQLFVREAISGIGVDVPGRIKPNAAISFLFLAVALLLFTSTRYGFTAFIARGLVLMTGSISFLAIVAGILQIDHYFTIKGYLPMVPLAAVNFLILSAALHNARPVRRRDITKIERSIIYSFILTLSLVTIIGIVIIDSHKAFLDDSNRVKVGETDINAIQEILSLVKDEETSARGYALTGNEDFLEPYYYAKTHLPLILKELVLHHVNDKEQSAYIQILQDLIRKKEQRSQEVINERRKGGLQSVAKLVGRGEGKSIMDEIREINSAMISLEAQQVKKSNEAALNKSFRSVLTMVFGMYMQYLLLIIVYLMMSSHLNKRKAAEKTLGNFFGLSIDMLCIAGFDGYFKRLNPCWMQTLGWTEKELLAEPFLDFVHPDDKQSTIDAASQLASGKDIVRFDNRYLCKDGTYKWIMWNSFPDVEQKLIYAVAHDFTARKNMEEMLRAYQSELEEKVRERTAELMSALDEKNTLFQAVEQSADSIFIINPEGNIEYVNSAFERLSGYLKKEIVGKSPLFFKYSTEDEELYQGLWEQALLGNPVMLEIANRKKSGEKYYVLKSMSSIKNEEGTIVHYVSSEKDITKEKLAELELRRLNEELEMRVAQRTLQLENVNKELEAFSYSVSHDLRAPLRGIDGFANILFKEMNDKLDEQSKDYLQRIRKASQRMGNLIEDMLRLSRINRIELQNEKINLSELARSICDEFIAEYPQRNIVFDIAGGMDLRGDINLMKIAIHNLIGNAIKYSKYQEKAIITIGTMIKDEKTVYFVKDNGVGFDMKYVDKLFGAFQRLHGANEFEGTGIGLATVQRIINRHGGTVWAEGIPNRGATFYFSL